jgi:hypothetical protein
VEAMGQRDGDFRSIDCKCWNPPKVRPKRGQVIKQLGDTRLISSFRNEVPLMQQV